MLTFVLRSPFSLVVISFFYGFVGEFKDFFCLIVGFKLSRSEPMLTRFEFILSADPVVIDIEQFAFALMFARPILLVPTPMISFKTYYSYFSSLCRFFVTISIIDRLVFDGFLDFCMALVTAEAASKVYAVLEPVQIPASNFLLLVPTEDLRYFWWLVFGPGLITVGINLAFCGSPPDATIDCKFEMCRLASDLAPWDYFCAMAVPGGLWLSFWWSLRL